MVGVVMVAAACELRKSIGIGRAAFWSLVTVAYYETLSADELSTGKDIP